MDGVVDGIVVDSVVDGIVEGTVDSIVDGVVEGGVVDSVVDGIVDGVVDGIVVDSVVDGIVDLIVDGIVVGVVDSKVDGVVRGLAQVGTGMLRHNMLDIFRQHLLLRVPLIAPHCERFVALQSTVNSLSKSPCPLPGSSAHETVVLISQIHTFTGESHCPVQYDHSINPVSIHACIHVCNTTSHNMVSPPSIVLHTPFES